MKIQRLAIGAFAASALILSGCSSSAIPDKPSSSSADMGAAAAEVTIRYGSIYTADTTFGVAVAHMADAIKEASNGSIDVQTFPGGTLGSEQNHAEAVQEGSLEMMESGTAGIGLYVPESALFELWYANDSLDSLVAAFKEATPKLDELYQAQGFKLLGTFYNGPRSIISTVPVRDLGDVQNLRLRVPGSELYVQMAKGLGAQATALPLGDVYTGLQTGSIDAMEGGPDDIMKSGYGEVAKYLTLDEHVFQPLSIIYSLDRWNALTPEQQTIVQDAATAASEEQKDLLQSANEKALADLEEQGVEIIKLSDRDEWVKKVQPAVEKFTEDYKATGQFILNALTKQ